VGEERKHLPQFLCSELNKKEKEERDLWGQCCSLYLLVYIVGIIKLFLRAVWHTYVLAKQIMIIVVVTVEYEPNRNAYICLIHYGDGEKRYILHPRGAI